MPFFLSGNDSMEAYGLCIGLYPQVEQKMKSRLFWVVFGRILRRNDIILYALNRIHASDYT